MNDGGKGDGSPARHPDTRVVNAGRDPAAHHGFVNPPVYHASTVLYPNAEDFVAHRARYQYGRRGTPTTEALESAMQELEGSQCAGVALLPSGLAAISAALLVGRAYRRPPARHRQRLRTDANVLRSDPHPARRHHHLLRSARRRRDRRADAAKYMRRLLKSPGSLSFEMQDVAAIAAAAHAKGALVLMDNTWATPLYFRALDFGVDLSIHAGTKYFGGHADVMLGTVSANGATVASLRNYVRLSGLVRRPRRCLSRPARAAHTRGAARASLPVRPHCGALAGTEA